MAHALRIDTLAFARRLKDAGADERLAEAIVEGIATADASDLATKTDIAEVRGDIARIENDLRTYRAETRADINGAIAKIGALMFLLMTLAGAVLKYIGS